MASRQPRRLVRNICYKPGGAAHRLHRPQQQCSLLKLCAEAHRPGTRGPGDGSEGTGINGARYREDHARGRSRTLLAVLLTAFLTDLAALRALTVNVDIASDMMAPQACEGKADYGTK